MNSSRRNQEIFYLALVDVVADLSREMPAEARYRRLLMALRRAFCCGAAALLRLHGSMLEPLAVAGFNEGMLGRGFSVVDQPRFRRIISSDEPVRFADAEWPDPYDGQFEGGPTSRVHDCIGATLHIGGRAWGVLTLNAFQVNAIDRLDPMALRIFIGLAEAAVLASRSIQAPPRQADGEFRPGQGLGKVRAGHELIGASPAMQALRRDIAAVAASGLIVKISGVAG
jgi:anaerobic nitric oxide reductase transcription regulator